MEAQFRWGPHTLSFEEPNIARVAYIGEVRLEHWMELIALIREYKARTGTVHLLIDGRKGNGISADARKAMSDDPSLVPFEATVFFGASFALKTIANMMGRAMAMLGRAPAGAMTFVDTEEEARAWLAGQREAAAKKAS